MEFNVTERGHDNKVFTSSADLDVDAQLDTSGVILERSVYCGNCMSMMHAVKPGMFTCPNCRHFLKK